MRHHFAGLWRQLGIEHVTLFDAVAARADLYVCDNSSTLYEFAALGRPVVVLNSPAYRRDLDLWPRFWRCADVGVQVDRPDDLEVAIHLALDDPPAIAARRRAVVDEVYPLLDGRAAQRSAEAILCVAGSVP
jgi:CDP-glycerol glycerophosphotransferase (TagB/SpsB family)